MEILHDVNLDKYTTFQLGGVCRNLYIPETEEELVEIVNENKDCKFIGGGSNLLINDEAVFEDVVLLKKFSDYIECEADGTTEVSASVSLGRLIKEINAKGFGGIEYLSSVPGLIGGAIYMNAGRGRAGGCSISDHIISVRALCLKDNGEVYKAGDVIEFDKDDCGFNYRSSIFKSGNYLILSAKLKFDPITMEEAQRLIQERRDWCQKTQDRSAPNFGSVFREQNRKLMRVIMKLGLGDSKGVHFSKKASNWLLNTEGAEAKPGTFRKTIKLIEKVKKLHKVFRKKCEAEVIIWEK